MSTPHFVYGIHAVSALINAQSDLILEIYVIAGRNDERVRQIIEQAEAQQIKLAKLSRKDLENIVGGASVHQGVVAKTRAYKGLDESILKELLAQDGDTLFLILDGVQDPHNLGACLRSSNAFGVSAVIAPHDRACGLTPVVRKVACGGAELTPFVQVKNLSRTLKWMQEQGVWIVGLAGECEAPLSEIDLTGNIALVLGSEGQGLRNLTQKHCDYVAKIPMVGQVESLNVSNAAAISLYEATRQRTVVEE